MCSGCCPASKRRCSRCWGNSAAHSFVADRALTGADRFAQRVDPQAARAQARRPTREWPSTYNGRARQAERLQTRIDCVDRLADRRQALAGQAPGLIGKLDALRTEREITSLRDELTACADELDYAFAAAARALDPLSYRLSRTRYRGVYRTATGYIVPCTDEHGRDRAREFDTLAQAHEFKRSLRDRTSKHGARSPPARLLAGRLSLATAMPFDAAGRPCDHHPLPRSTSHQRGE